MSAALKGLVVASAEIDQPRLFETPENGALGGQEDADSTGTAPAKRAAGRPAGSRNRATEDRRRYYLSRHSDPLEGAIVLSLPPDAIEAITRARALARLAGCKTLEMLEFMRRATADALPYLHARAVNVELSGKVAHAHIGLLAPRIGTSNEAGIDQLRAWLDQGLAELEPAARAAIEAVAHETENDENSEA